MTQYFSHDYNSRNDTKIQKIWASMGLEGVGLYWCLVEKLYESHGYIMRSDCEGIAFEMRTQCEKVIAILNSDLFENDEEKYWSESALRRLEQRNEKGEKARKNAEKRWNKQKNANALQTECKGNANKEKETKEKKRKEKEIKQESMSSVPADQRFRAFVEVFNLAWEKHRTGNPGYGPKDFGALKAMLKKHPEATDESFTLACKNCIADSFHGKNFSLCYVSGQYAKLINLKLEANNGTNSGRTRLAFEADIDTKYDGM